VNVPALLPRAASEVSPFSPVLKRPVDVVDTTPGQTDDHRVAARALERFYWRCDLSAAAASSVRVMPGLTITSSPSSGCGCASLLILPSSWGRALASFTGARCYKSRALLIASAVGWIKVMNLVDAGLRQSALVRLPGPR
jgi:hypothetical protein